MKLVFWLQFWRDSSRKIVFVCRRQLSNCCGYIGDWGGNSDKSIWHCPQPMNNAQCKGQWLTRIFTGSSLCRYPHVLNKKVKKKKKITWTPNTCVAWHGPMKHVPVSLAQLSTNRAQLDIQGPCGIFIPIDILLRKQGQLTEFKIRHMCQSLIW